MVINDMVMCIYDVPLFPDPAKHSVACSTEKEVETRMGRVWANFSHTLALYMVYSSLIPRLSPRSLGMRLCLQCLCHSPKPTYTTSESVG